MIKPPICYCCENDRCYTSQLVSHLVRVFQQFEGKQSYLAIWFSWSSCTDFNLDLNLKVTTDFVVLTYSKSSRVGNFQLANNNKFCTLVNRSRNTLFAFSLVRKAFVVFPCKQVVNFALRANFQLTELRSLKPAYTFSFWWILRWLLLDPSIRFRFCSKIWNTCFNNKCFICLILGTSRSFVEQLPSVQIHLCCLESDGWSLTW